METTKAQTPKSSTFFFFFFFRMIVVDHHQHQQSTVIHHAILIINLQASLLLPSSSTTLLTLRYHIRRRSTGRTLVPPCTAYSTQTSSAFLMLLFVVEDWLLGRYHTIVWYDTYDMYGTIWYYRTIRYLMMMMKRYGTSRLQMITTMQRTRYHKVPCLWYITSHKLRHKLRKSHRTSHKLRPAAVRHGIIVSYLR